MPLQLYYGDAPRGILGQTLLKTIWEFSKECCNTFFVQCLLLFLDPLVSKKSDEKYFFSLVPQTHVWTIFRALYMLTLGLIFSHFKKAIEFNFVTLSKGKVLV